MTDDRQTGGIGIKLAFVIPTKDRPEKLATLLDSLCAQKPRTSLRIIVVASGQDVKDVIAGYKDSLCISYIYSDHPGQIFQRNLGINKLLQSQVDFIGFIDDDIVFDVNSIAAMHDFLNKKTPRHHTKFGVGFNIIEEQSTFELPYLWLRRALLRIGDRPGQVVKTGWNTSITNVENDCKTEWLGGGFTVWGREVLREYQQSAIQTEHAACEDLIFSYPIGKVYPLFICANARVIHDDQGPKSLRRVLYLTKKHTLAHLYFCKQHKEFSSILFILSGAIFSCLLLLGPKGKRGLGEFLGFWAGLGEYLRRLLFNKNVLED
jgi:glycosyltransferase involved in cell wall biosynthesis